MKVRWWMISAASIGVLMMMLGVGNLIEEDGGPLYGQLLLLAAMATGAALIAAGLVLMRSKQRLGSKLVGLGVAPGAVGIAFFWFPPAVIVGVVAIVSSVKAFEASRPSREQAATA